MKKPQPLQVRAYGVSGPLVIVLHGGPGAAGEAAPLARGLADSFQVLEPFQRGSGSEPLTVAHHVADLHDLVRSRGVAQPALVGESWGAMLALAYTAAHSDGAGPLVLIGCGTFDDKAREQLHATLDERTDDTLRERLQRLEDVADPVERFVRRRELTEPLYSYDPFPAGDESCTETFDLRAHEEAWADMVRLQKEGVYPAAFSAITSPVLMLHGAYDPHPGRMIRASLQPYLPQLEYVEFERCGHYPWLERAAHDEFFAVLRGWLAHHLGEREPC